jgi:hypothetical protein
VRAPLSARIAGVLAVTGEFAWPNDYTNEIDRVHTWLNAQWRWLERW